MSTYSNPIYQILFGYDNPFGLSELYYELQPIIAGVALVGLIIALLQCFFGFKLIKFWIAVQGFILGAIIGFFIGGLSTKSTPAAVIFAFIGAVLGAFIAYKLYKIGVFLTCLFMGFAIFGTLAAFIDPSFIIPLGLFGGIILGVIGVIFIQPVFIITTALSGGMTAGGCLATIVNAGPMFDLLFGIIFVVVGLIIQIKMNGGLFESKNKKNNTYQNYPNYNPNSNPGYNPNGYSNYNPNGNPGYNTSGYSNNYPSGNQGYNPNGFPTNNQNGNPVYNPQPQLQPQPLTILCPQCSNVCDENAKFCDKCGAQLR